MPGLLAALHALLPHSIDAARRLIRINAGCFGAEKMVNCFGRIDPTPEMGSRRNRGSKDWRET
jgi:hypothetical protein